MRYKIRVEFPVGAYEKQIYAYMVRCLSLLSEQYDIRQLVSKELDNKYADFYNETVRKITHQIKEGKDE